MKDFPEELLKQWPLPEPHPGKGWRYIGKGKEARGEIIQGLVHCAMPGELWPTDPGFNWTQVPVSMDTLDHHYYMRIIDV